MDTTQSDHCMGNSALNAVLALWVHLCNYETFLFIIFNVQVMQLYLYFREKCLKTLEKLVSRKDCRHKNRSLKIVNLLSIEVCVSSFIFCKFTMMPMDVTSYWH